MKYFIVSEEELQNLQHASIGFGMFKAENMDPKLLLTYAAEVKKTRQIEIPDYIDVIVGYSSPNPSHCTLWERNGDKIERMEEDDE